MENKITFPTPGLQELRGRKKAAEALGAAAFEEQMSKPASQVCSQYNLV